MRWFALGMVVFWTGFVWLLIECHKTTKAFEAELKKDPEWEKAWRKAGEDEGFYA